MAEKSAELITREDKINQAKEYYGRGSRNYLVKDYSEAAEDFSRSCELYAELYGENADELGLPHLYYAKALIALAQGGENKVLALQDEDEEEEEGDAEADGEHGDDGNEEVEEDNDDDENATNNDKEIGDTVENASKEEVKSVANGDDAGAATSSSSNVNAVEPQPGTSSGQTNGINSNSNGVSEQCEIPEEEEEDATNLQYAWEALEIAVKIFSRMGQSGLAHLADAHYELAEISLEIDHCTEAVKDYERSCEIYLQLPDDNLRIIAEAKYKIGLCYDMAGKFDEAIAAFKDASEYLNGVAEAEKRKEQNEKTEATIKEIEETRQEIALKINEVLEAKEQSIEEVKREIAKFMNPIPDSTSNGSGSLSSAGGISKTEIDKPKASDISHLIKRKKPDTPAEPSDGASPAKKPAI